MGVSAVGGVGEGGEDVFFGKENGGDGGEDFLEVCFTGHGEVPFYF